MSTTIDQKVVEMRFDNKQFESATATTMSTLDKLKQKLGFNGATKGLESISNAAKKVDMSGLGSAVESVGSKFSALEVMGVTALANITNSAVNAGKRIISSLTIDPIFSGFQEYETQMNAIQTILANTQSKGSTLEDVTSALDELNTYADQTIYNFTEMTRNIGTFTAAGVDLDKSVSSIKGIANLAAVSGSTSMQASTAMYQLSQALAAGKVQLMDWNSVVNAGMGGQLFQDALKRTATQMGHNVDALIEKYGSFRESLTEGNWLTAEVLTETLTQLSGAYTEADLIAQGYTEQQAKDIVELANTAIDAATKVKTFTQLLDTMKEAAGSGWAKTWQLVLGDFEEAKEFFTGLSDYFGEMINASSDARNTLLEGALDSNWSKLTKEIEGAGVPLQTFSETLKQVAKEHNINIESMIEEQGSLAKVMESGSVSGDIVLDTLKKIAGTSDEFNNSTMAMADKLEYFQKVVDEVWYGKWFVGQERIEALTKAGYDYAEVQRLVNLTEDGRRLTLEDLTETEMKAIGYTDEQIKAIKALAEEAEKAGTSLNDLIANLDKPSGRVLLLETLSNTIKAVIEPLRAVKRAFNEVFAIEPGQLYGIIEALHRFSEAILMDEASLDKLTRTFKGIFGVFKIFTSFIGGGFGLAFNIITGILEKFDLGLLDVTAKIGDVVYAITDFITSGNIITTVIGGIVSLFEGASGPISSFINKLSEIPAVKTAFEGISNFISKVRNEIQSFSKMVSEVGIGEAFNTWYKSIKNTLSNLTWEDVLDGLRSFGEKVRTTFSNIAKDMKTVGPEILEKLKDGLSSGVGKVIEKAREIGSKIVEAIKAVLGIDTKSGEMERAGEGVFQGYINGLSKGAEGIFSAIRKIASSAVDTIETMFGNINWNKVAAVAISAGLLVTVKKLVDAVAAIAAPLQGVGDILSGVGEVIEKAAKPIAKTIKGLANVLNSYALGIKADALKSVATAIGILAASVFLLAQLDSPKLWEAIGALAALSGIMALLSIGLGKFGPESAVQFAGFAAAVLGIAVSLSIVASALKKLESLDPNKMDQTIAGFTVVVLGLGALIAICGAMVKGGAAKDIAQFGTLMLSLSASLLLMTVAIKLISGIDTAGLVKGGAAIVVFTRVVAVIAAISKNVGPGVSSLGGTMIKLTIALGLMVVVIKLISGLDAGEIIKGGVAIAAFLGVIKILTTITNTSGPMAAKLGTTMIALSASMLILVGVIALVSMISPADLIKGTAALTLFAGVIGILVKIMNMADKEVPKMSANLLAMSAAIAILAGVAIVLSLIDLGGLAKGVAAVGILSTFMAGLMIATKYANDCKGNLIVMSVAIGVMAASVAALSFIDPADLAGATAALSILMGMFALLVKSANNITGSMGVLITMSVTIGILGGIIYLLSDLPIGSALSSAASLSLLLLSLAGAIKLMNNLGTISTKAYLSLGAMMLVLLALSGILYLLKDLPVESTIPVIASLSALLTSLLIATAALGAIGKFLGGAGAVLQGVAGLAAVVVALGGLMVGIGALAEYFPAMESFLDTGIVLLEKIGYGLGSFFGNVIGGFTAGLTSGLPEMGSDLSAFMDGAKPFFDGLSKIDTSAINGVKTLADTILTLSGANILDAIGSFLSGESSLMKFGEEIVPFGKAMNNFAKELGDFDGDTVESAANAGKALAEMASAIPNSGGIAAFFAGENDMGVFSEQIVAFGKAMKSYSEAISGIDSKVVADSATAGKALTEMASTVPNSGGLLAFFAGENDIDDFAKKIVPFGKAMKDYGDSVVGLKASVITDSVTAGKALIELANTVPNSGGVWGFFAGENDVDDFGAKLVPFGKAMKEYGDAVKGIDADSIVNSATAGNALVKLADTVPNTGGLVAFFSGDNDLATFGEQLISFGESMAKYSESVKDIEPDVVTSTANAADSLVTLAERLPEDKLFKNETTLDDFGKQMSKFGEYFRKYYDSVSGIEVGTLTPIVEAVGDLVDIAKGMGEVDTGAMSSFGKALSKLGKTGIEEFVKAFKDSTKTIQNAATEMVNTFIDAANSKSKDVSSTFTNLISDALESINSKSSEFKRAGSECMSKFVSGIQSRENSSTSAFRQIISNCLTSITSKNQSFYTAGQSSMSKFVEGIKSKESIMNSSFTTMLNSAINAITSKKSTFVSSGESLISGFTNAISSKNQSLSSSFTNGLSLAVSSIKSYYTNFYNAGSYLATGFANGISSQSSVVAKKASNMASVAYSTTMNKIQARSPSKLFTKVGSYVPLGFARGIENGGSEVEKSISYMTKTAVESTSKTISKIIDAFNGDIDTQPTIRPVLDLSNVQAGTKKINALFSSKQAISISSDLDSDNGSKIQNGVSGTKNGSVFQFTQNNYSPKALSRVEIYRQTNNQFSAFERMAET